MNTPIDGRLTSQNVLNLPLVGGEVMEIVSPGNAAQGNTYQVTTAVLAAYFASSAAISFFTPTVITAGATIGSPYPIKITDTSILFDKSVGSASYAVAPLASTMVYPFGILIADVIGDAGTNPITITFSGGQLCSGLATAQILNPWGWLTIRPIPNGSGWFQTYG